MHAKMVKEYISDSKYTKKRERGEGERERLTDWLNFYYTRIEVKAQMPVEQPVLDTNYKHLKVTRT